MNIEHKNEEGAVLVVGLIMLLVITLVGVSSISGANIEEKMAGNVKNKHLAFEAAEAAIRDGEQFLDSIVSVASFNGSNGLLGAPDATPNYFASTSWSSGNSKQYQGGSISNVASLPRYIIKHKGKTKNNLGSLNVGRYGSRNVIQVQVFELTARGTGGNDTARVILQSHYGKAL